MAVPDFSVENANMSDDSFFSVEFDAATGLLTATLRKQWTVATLASYIARLLVEAAKLRWRREPFDVLCDAREMPVQSQLVVNGFSKTLDIAAASNVGSIAVVVTTMLNKFQAERTVNAPNVRVFLSLDEATEWLAQRRSERGA